MPNYIKKVLPMMGMDGCAGVNTPASHMTVLTPHAPDQVPDISFIVGALVHHTQTYTNTHITAIECVLHYLLSSSEVGLHYKAYDNNDIEIAYANASYGNKEEGRKSISGYVFMFCGAAVAWSSKSQPIVATSTQEAEYITLTHATKHITSKNLPGTKHV
ncbi:polyprotein [Ceratobasidium theobromae]|uniref:Polyprotein n=1 Tax=Ceratobasidium theobromae TaxID=1582974 RepID=A0A5N5Q5H5_9AGAM|nr:polyprotein [Ceratobasidium theobromae]